MDQLFVFSASLPRHVRQPDLLNVVSGCRELDPERKQAGGCQGGDVIGEVVLEEVPALLTINREHGHHVA